MNQESGTDWGSRTFCRKDYGQSYTGNYWEISDIILEKIEGPSSIKNKTAYNMYLIDNPIIAHHRGINLFVPDF